MCEGRECGRRSGEAAASRGSGSRGPWGRPTTRKAPKTLGPGVWAKQIKEFENFYTPARVFPQQMVYGAEEVLARLLWEKDVSKMYTPLGLGEIVASRSYTSTGQVNKFTTEDKAKETFEFRQGAGNSVNLEAKTFTCDPKSARMVEDGMDANKWALVFAGYATEEVADKCMNQFKKNLRTKGNPQMCTDLYEAASLKLVLEMRAGKDFSQATRELIEDRHWWSDWLDEYKEYPLKRKWSNGDGPGKQSVVRSNPAKGTHYPTGKGAKGKKNSYGKREAKQFCFHYNSGWCENPKPCRYIHACSICGDRGHKVVDTSCGTWGSVGKTRDATKGKGKWTKGADKSKGKGKADKGKSWY